MNSGFLIIPVDWHELKMANIMVTFGLLDRQGSLEIPIYRLLSKEMVCLYHTEDLMALKGNRYKKHNAQLVHSMDPQYNGLSTNGC